MTVTGNCLEVFSFFFVTQSPLDCVNVEILTVPTTSFIYNFEHLRTGEPVFVGEKRLDAMCVLENNPKVNGPIKFIYTSLELFGNNSALQLAKSTFSAALCARNFGVFHIRSN